MTHHHRFTASTATPVPFWELRRKHETLFISTQLSLAGITFSYPARVVFKDLDFSACPGERLGINGENGAGKTMLLRRLAGELHPESGTLIRQAAGGFGRLRQRPHFEQHWSVTDVGAHALSGMLELEARIVARASGPRARAKRSLRARWRITRR